MESDSEVCVCGLFCGTVKERMNTSVIQNQLTACSCNASIPRQEGSVASSRISVVEREPVLWQGWAGEEGRWSVGEPT